MIALRTRGAACHGQRLGITRHAPPWAFCGFVEPGKLRRMAGGTMVGMSGLSLRDST